MFRYFLEGMNLDNRKCYYRGVVIADSIEQATEKIIKLYGGYIDVKPNFDTLEIDLINGILYIDGRCLWEDNVWETHEMFDEIPD